MGKILLLRHGRTDANQRGLWCGWSESALVAPPFSGARISCAVDALFVSPLKRCLSYKEYFSASETSISDLVREISFGEWEGLSFNAIAERDPERAALYLQTPFSFRFPGGESLDDLVQRAGEFASVLRPLCDADRTIGVVSHEGFIKAFILKILEGTPELFWKLRIENEKWCVIDYFSHEGKLFFVVSGLNVESGAFDG